MERVVESFFGALSYNGVERSLPSSICKEPKLLLQPLICMNIDAPQIHHNCKLVATIRATAQVEDEVFNLFGLQLCLQLEANFIQIEEGFFRMSVKNAMNSLLFIILHHHSYNKYPNL